MWRAVQVAIVPQSVDMMASSSALVQLIGDDLRLHGLIAARPSLLHQLAAIPPCGAAPVVEKAAAPASAVPSAAARQARARNRRPVRCRAGYRSPIRCRIDVDLDAFDAGPASGRTRYRGSCCRRSGVCRTLPAPPAPVLSLTNQRRRRRTGCCREARLFREGALPLARQALRHSRELIASVDGPAPG